MTARAAGKRKGAKTWRFFDEFEIAVGLCSGCDNVHLATSIARRARRSLAEARSRLAAVMAVKP